MFIAVNTELEGEREQIKFEEDNIITFYNNAVNNKSYESFLEIKIKYDENSDLLEQSRSNIVYNYIKNTNLEYIDKNIQKIKFYEYEKALFCYIKKLISSKNYMKAKKFINIARKKNWINNEFIKLDREIVYKYYNGMNE